MTTKIRYQFILPCKYGYFRYMEYENGETYRRYENGITMPSKQKITMQKYMRAYIKHIMGFKWG